jgi:cytochrome b pre-mRNA-processing protein 3
MQQGRKAKRFPGRPQFMFQRLFGRERSANRAITEALYASIVAAARQEPFYSEWNVPDTPLGRFEMLSLHMFLFQYRMRGETGASRDLAQILIDEFFSDVDHSLRELGIGDLGIPKRMKKLARMFYGRTAAYADALERGDLEALAAALARNIRPDAAAWPQSAELAAYVADADGMLALQQSEEIHSGAIVFPVPQPA